jgi:hypothetical protein
MKEEWLALGSLLVNKKDPGENHLQQHHDRGSSGVGKRPLPGAERMCNQHYFKRLQLWLSGEYYALRMTALCHHLSACTEDKS